MEKVHFTYSQKSDIRNWVRIFQKNTEEIRDALKWFGNNSLPESIQELETLLTSHLKSSDIAQKISETQKTLAEGWGKVETSYFQALEDLTGNSIYTDSFTCALTTLHICPYDINHNWFMLSVRSDKDRQITNIAHELFHLQFLHYFQKILNGKKLSNEKRFETIESMTVLLNSEKFQKILPAKDKGYSAHEDMRNKILSLSHSGKTIQEMINSL